jgi:uncharacterized protein (UPF0248 family)
MNTMKHHSYNFLSCTLNRNLASLIEQLTHMEYNLKTHHLILNKVKDAELKDKNQEPISFELYNAWKIIAKSNGLTSAASFRWSLESIYRELSNFFEKINYEEIEKMEITERENISQKIKKLASEADSIAKSYNVVAQPSLVEHLNYCHKTAYDRYHWIIEHRKTLHELMINICEEVTKKLDLELHLHEKDSIFNCTIMENLIYTADYFSLAPREKNIDWLMNELAWGKDPIYKFFNIQTSLLLLISIKKEKGAELNTHAMSVNDIKKIAKAVHKLSKKKLEPFHKELKISTCKSPDQHLKTLTQLYQDMSKLLDKLNHSSIPQVHDVSEEEARKLQSNE